MATIESTADGFSPAGSCDVSVIAIALLPALAALVLWAIVDLEKFVLFAVLGAMIVPVSLAKPGGANIAGVDLLLAIAVAAWLASNSIGRAPDPWIRANPMFLPAVFFTATAAASLAWSINPRSTLVWTIQVFEITIVVPLVFASIPRSVETIRRAFLAFTLFTCLLAVAALVAYVANPGMHAQGTYLPGWNKNPLGSFLAAGLVIAFALLLASRLTRTRLALILAFFVDGAGMVATGSRGAILGAAVALIFVSFMLGRQRLIALITLASLAVVFAVVVGPEATKKKTLAGGYDSSVVRQYAWAGAIKKIEGDPFLGTGGKTYTDTLPQLYGFITNDPNNLFLLTWAELGLAGISSLLYLLFRFGRMLAQARHLPGNAAVLAVAAGSVAISLLVHFQVDVSWARGSTTLEYAMIGVMVALIRLSRPVHSPPYRFTDGVSAAVTPKAAVSAVRSVHQYGGVPSTTATDAAATPDQSAHTMRVLHVVGSHRLAGTELHVLRLVKELRLLGCEAEIVCSPLARSLVSKARASELPLHRHLRGAVHANPDIVHVHDGHSALIGAVIARRTRATFIRTQHFVRPASAVRPGLRGIASALLQRQINRRLDGYIAVSRAAAEAARARGDTRTANLAVIPPGIEVPPSSVVTSATSRRADANYPLVVSVGRLEPERRFDVLIDAIPLVCATIPSCRFVIAGKGSAAAELQHRAAACGVSGMITWKPWLDSVADLMAEGHVYVNTWPWEGFGMAMAEAMSYGLPVIAPQSGASPELVQPGVTGELVAAGDPTDLAAAICSMLANPSSAAALGANGREQIGARHSVTQTAQRTLGFYHQARGA
jgi:glycosyltransferase involved in cell wall biosynthesis